MKKPTVLLGVLFAVIVLGVLIYSSMNLSSERVEVCVSFHGAQACAKASADNKEDALRAATTTACAQVSSGVTDTIACQDAQPVKTTWSNK